MSDPRNRRRTNWGSVISTILFLLLIGARPLIGLISSIFTPSALFTSNLNGLVIGAIMVCVVLAVVIRVANASRSGSSAPRLPPLSRSPGAPLPPVAGPRRPDMPSPGPSSVTPGLQSLQQQRPPPV